MKEDCYIETRHGTVRKKNELIQQTRFNLSAQEQKIMLYLISQVSPQDEDFMDYQFTIADFCKICGIEYNGKNYHDLKETLKGLRDKSFWFFDNNEIVTVGWLAKVRISPKTGNVKIRLDEDLKPFLLNIKERFTAYELLWTLNFKSKYTIRLYEYIKSIHFHKDEIYIKDCPLDALKGVMGAEKYKAYTDFKKRVLIPAVEEINEYSDESIEFKEIKKGRWVAEIRLTISPKERWEVIKLKGAIEDKFELNQLTIWERLSDSST